MKSDSGQCNAVTKSGKRCKRSSKKFGRYCQQHSDMLEESLWSHTGKLEYVPEPPPVLSQMAAGYWRMYCRDLIEHQKLHARFLSELFELCRRHDYRVQIEKMIEKHGLINIYDNGLQPSGLDKMLDRNDKRITDLKKIFGLTLDTESNLSGGTKQKENPKQAPMRKVKKSW